MEGSGEVVGGWRLGETVCGTYRSAICPTNASRQPATMWDEKGMLYPPLRERAEQAELGSHQPHEEIIPTAYGAYHDGVGGGLCSEQRKARLPAIGKPGRLAAMLVVGQAFLNAARSIFGALTFADIFAAASALFCASPP